MTHLLGRPRTRRRTLLAALAGVALAGVIALAAVYFLLFPTSSPKPFALTTSTVATPVSATTPLGGRWAVAAGSQAGYRVREKLAFLPAQSDAVGRTSAITGGATVTEAGGRVTVTAAAFSVDVSRLTSDQSMRDQHIRTIGLQSDQYPTATFRLLGPVTLPANALSGRVVHVSATGVFDIHGTSRRETVPLQMGVSSASLQAVGSLTFPWSEFNMTAPSVGGFVSVDGTATMEFALHLTRA